jgi:voltage-gated potassium channel
MENKFEARELKNPSYEVFILLLSLLSIFNILVLITPWGNEVVEDVIEIVDIYIVIIFFVDFLYRFFTAESKGDYFFRNWGWADLLSSMPIPYFRIFRIFRVVDVIRLIREFGFREMLAAFRKNRAESVLVLVIFMVILVIEFGGIGIVYAEAGHPDANIKTGGDGVWWSFVSITTVGYGDRYPVTRLGRLVAILTLVLGLSTFGAFTGYVTDAFLSGRMEESDDGKPSDQTGEISELRSLLEEQARLNLALIKKLDQMDHSNET